MIKNDFFVTLKESVEKYSFNGDRSLEYIGLTLDYNQEISYKIYRSNKNDFCINNTDLPLAVKQFNLNMLRLNHNLSLLDCSFRKAENRDSSYSLSYNLTENNAINEIDFLTTSNNLLSKNFNDYFGEKCSLFQVGYLLNCNANILEYKCYYKLNLFEENLGAMEKIDNIKKYKDNIGENFTGLFNEENRESVMRVFADALNYNYRPFLIGKNEYGKSYEFKIYYVLNVIMSKKKANKHFFDFIKKYNVNKDLLDMIECCDENDLFLRGFAVSFKSGKCKWRFYFFPKKN